MSNHLKVTDTIYDITEKYPETINFFVANGFDKMSNPIMRNTIGKTVTLEMALSMRKMNAEAFLAKLDEVIHQALPDAGTGLAPMVKEDGGDIRIEGVLPCPIRLPLMENSNPGSVSSPISLAIKWIII